MKLRILFAILFFGISLTVKSQADAMILTKSDWVSQHFNSEFYNNQFTGFYLYDPETKEVLENINGEKFFTPASNVKIFTLYSAMKVLPDSIPALRYEWKNDDLYIEGMGDPTFLHPEFKHQQKALEYMKDTPGNIYLHWGKFQDSRLGMGWSWEDYEAHFSPERSEFPVYGNVAVVRKSKKGVSAFPLTLSDSVEYRESLFNRDFSKNKFYVGSRNGASTKVPFITRDETIRLMLSEAIDKEVHLTDYQLPKNADILFSVPSDLVYKKMMENSDNFLAEQLLLMVSNQVSNTMNTEKAVNYMKSVYMKDIPQDPVWVDGSGLSRYNLFSPRDMAYILEKLLEEYPRERLFDIFAIGGRTGTLKRNYGGRNPYVYAKSGTLSNNYSLSGYLITDSGRTLIFSVMNNHYRQPNWQIRKQTQELLEFVRDNY